MFVSLPRQGCFSSPSDIPGRTLLSGSEICSLCALLVFDLGTNIRLSVFRYSLYAFASIEHSGALRRRANGACRSLKDLSTTLIATPLSPLLFCHVHPGIRSYLAMHRQRLFREKPSGNRSSQPLVPFGNFIGAYSILHEHLNVTSTRIIKRHLCLHHTKLLRLF